MSCIDGFVAAVPTANREACRRHSEEAAHMFKGHGALQVVEAWGDDVPPGEVTSFEMAVRKMDDETVVLARIVWPHQATRDDASAKMAGDMSDTPFDGQRMIHGGFRPIVEP